MHSQVLQNVAVRVDLVFQAFYRRCRDGGEKPGFPRFKGTGRYNSLTYPQATAFRLDDQGLRVSKIGCLHGVWSRPLEGAPKTCTIRRSATGKWFATIICEVEAQPLPASDEAVGIDGGEEQFAALSNGEVVANPGFFRQDEKALAKAQRKLSKAAKGSPERQKARKVVARVHERIRHRRHDFVHQHARRIVNRYGLIAVEALHVKAMVHNRYLVKSISDAAWLQFRHVLSYKAAEAGRILVAVNPAYAS